ncbi:MAG: hypothetical protein ACK4I8_03665 [Armatimonadota bacterium]
MRIAETKEGTGDAGRGTRFGRSAGRQVRQVGKFGKSASRQFGRSVSWETGKWQAVWGGGLKINET